jgi:hypothetical protein
MFRAVFAAAPVFARPWIKKASLVRNAAVLLPFSQPM